MAFDLFQQFLFEAKSVLDYLEVFLGGLFGLYLILVILRWRESVRMIKILKKINTNIEQIADHLGVKRPVKKSKIQRIREKLKNGSRKKPQRRKPRRSP